jgi:hypothetical protein
VDLISFSNISASFDRLSTGESVSFCYCVNDGRFSKGAGIYLEGGLLSFGEFKLIDGSHLKLNDADSFRIYQRHAKW